MPERSNPQFTTGVIEKEYPTICLRKLHLTAGVLSILVAGVASFLECCFFNGLGGCQYL
jgi:hypothetical protein